MCRKKKQEFRGQLRFTNPAFPLHCFIHTQAVYGLRHMRLTETRKLRKNSYQLLILSINIMCKINIIINAIIIKLYYFVPFI